MTVEVITEAEALAALEPDWWRLLGRSPAATPFSSPAWLLPWWATFRPGRLCAVAVRHAGVLVGLAPLYIEAGPRGRRLLPLGIGLSDHMDVLVDPSHTDAGRALIEAVGEIREPWDLWSAEEAAPGAAVLALPALPGWTTTIERQTACPVLPLAPSEAGKPSIPARQQRKWRMARNRADRRGWSLAATTEATLTDDLAHLFRLHGSRWQSRGEAGVLADAAVRRFHAAAAPRLLAAGLLRLTVLRIDEAVAGVYYGLRQGSSAYAYLGGFDPAFAFESPGTLLIGAAIAAAEAEGAEAFDFLRGQEAYKYRWGAADRWNSRRVFTVAR